MSWEWLARVRRKWPYHPSSLSLFCYDTLGLFLQSYSGHTSPSVLGPKYIEAKTSFCDFFASPRWQYAVMPNCMILTRLQISFARLTRISQKKTLFFAALLTATENEGHSSCFLLLALLSFIFITIFHGKYCFHSCSHVSTPGVPSADRRRKPKQPQYRTRLHSFSLSSGWSKKYCSIPRLYVVWMA